MFEIEWVEVYTTLVKNRNYAKTKVGLNPQLYLDQTT